MSIYQRPCYRRWQWSLWVSFCCCAPCCCFCRSELRSCYVHVCRSTIALLSSTWVASIRRLLRRRLMWFRCLIFVDECWSHTCTQCVEWLCWSDWAPEFVQSSRCLAVWIYWQCRIFPMEMALEYCFHAAIAFDTLSNPLAIHER